MAFIGMAIGAGSAILGGTAFGAGATGMAALGNAVAAGAGWGALAGQVMGGNTSSTLSGAGIGAATGGVLGAWGGGAGGAGTTATEGAAQFGLEATINPAASTISQLGAGGVGPVATGGAAGGGLGVLSGLGQWAAKNPLMTAGLATQLAGVMMGGAVSGPQMQEKITMSKEGKQLEENVLTNVKSDLDQAKAGDVRERAFGAVSNLNSGEDNRNLAASRMITANLANTRGGERLDTAGGGNDVKGMLMNAGQRSEGLTASAKTQVAIREEYLRNSINNVKNIHNIERQVGSIEMNNRFAQQGIDQLVDAQRGQSYGSLVNTVGNFMYGNAKMNRVNKIAGV